MTTEVKFSTVFNWLSCSNNICLFQISLFGYKFFITVSLVSWFFFQRSFTLILEAWDWDNDTKAGEYVKLGVCTYSVLHVCKLGRGKTVSCCNQPSLQISYR